MKPGSLRIHVLAPLPGNLVPDRARLNAEELVRAAAFRNPEDASRWAFCRGALRETLGEMLGLAPMDVPLATTTHGKPYLPPPFGDLHFNLSHCTGLALIVVCLDGPVGVDVESAARAVDLLGCEESFCHPDEILELPMLEKERAIALLEIWTAKEAMLKALGTGLSHPPETIRLHMDAADIRVSPDTLPRGLKHHVIGRLRHLLPGGYMAAVCHPRVSEIFEFDVPLESTSAATSITLPAVDTRSDG